MSGSPDPKSVESMFPEHFLYRAQETIIIYFLLYNGDAGAITFVYHVIKTQWFPCKAFPKYSWLPAWRFFILFVLGQANLM